MIKTLKVENFKSIESHELKLARINVFIGEPGTGKSNILEAIGLLSLAYYAREPKLFVRHEHPVDLFHQQRAENPIKVEFDDTHITAHMVGDRVEISYSDGDQGDLGTIFTLYSGDSFTSRRRVDRLAAFKLYRFTPKTTFTSRGESLLPPDGDNLIDALRLNPALRSISQNLLTTLGLKLVQRPYERKVEAMKELPDGSIVSLPLTLISDTLARMIFNYAAIYTNKGAVIALEEPEAHAFPYHTKVLAESIALHKDNQYLISTHN
ncbi:MAG: hypothetical protein DRJ97_07150, partial [Thermoprotei archaeon]